MATRHQTLVVMLILVVGGCRDTDPVLRSDLWHPVGVNETNIAAMVASPADLVRGVEEQGSDGVRAAAAVRRLETNHVKSLPDSGISDLKIQGSGGGQGSSDGSNTGGGTVGGGT